jgi:gas vesicle protein
MTAATKVTLGIIGAVAAGVAIGLLIAPEKGSDMRKKVQRTASGWADNLTQLFNDGKEALDDMANTVKGKTKSAKATAEDKANSVKESFS